jgi:hypothetical protein
MKHAVSRYRAPFVTGFPFPLVTGPGVDAADTCTDTRFWLGVREVFPVAVAKSGRAALSRCKVFIGNFVLPPRVSTVLPGQLPSIRTGTSYRPPAADRILSAPLVYRLVSLKKLTRQTHRAHKSNVNDILMAKTRRTKVDLLLRWHAQGPPYRRWRQKGHLRPISLTHGEEEDAQLGTAATRPAFRGRYMIRP